MCRHYLRWLPAVILLAVTAIATTAWAKTGHVTIDVVCPGVDSGGNLTIGGGVRVPMTVTVNETTRAYHGTVHTTVENHFGHNVTFSNSSFDFEAPGLTKSKCTVKANGSATLTISGVLTP